MPIEHKAYRFAYRQFAEELLPVLVDALVSQNSATLIRFIEAHRESLRHPDEGTPLDGEWRKLIERGDPQEYGDFALTRYYTPDNIGLGYEWEEIQDIIGAARPDLERSPILGQTIGPLSNLFDPGKLGSYFQSPTEVAANHAIVHEIAAKWGVDLLGAAIRMLEAVQGIGLYVTF